MFSHNKYYKPSIFQQDFRQDFPRPVLAPLIKDSLTYFQGYYDPTKSRIVHLAMNPLSLAKQQRGEELEKLKKENETLRRRLQILEEGGCNSDDLSPGFSKFSPENAPSVVKQVEGQCLIFIVEGISVGWSMKGHRIFPILFSGI